MLNKEAADFPNVVSPFEIGSLFDEACFEGYESSLEALTYVSDSVVICSEDPNVKEKGLFTHKEISKGDFIGTYFGEVVAFGGQEADTPMKFDWATVKDLLSAVVEPPPVLDCTYVIWGQGDAKGKGIEGTNNLRYSNQQHFLSSNMVLKGL